MIATDEDLAKLTRIMNEFGHMVITSHEEHWSGKILTRIENLDGIPFMVIGETDLADYRRQCAAIGSSSSDVRSYFYRVTTD